MFPFVGDRSQVCAIDVKRQSMAAACRSRQCCVESTPPTESATRIQFAPLQSLSDIKLCAQKKISREFSVRLLLPWWRKRLIRMSQCGLFILPRSFFLTFVQERSNLFDRYVGWNINGH